MGLALRLQHWVPAFFLFFCTMAIFVKLAAVLFAVTFFACLFALMALPAALLVIGPVGRCGFGPMHAWMNDLPLDYDVDPDDKSGSNGVCCGLFGNSQEDSGGALFGSAHSERSRAHSERSRVSSGSIATERDGNIGGGAAHTSNTHGTS